MVFVWWVGRVWCIMWLLYIYCVFRFVVVVNMYGLLVFMWLVGGGILCVVVVSGISSSMMCSLCRML